MYKICVFAGTKEGRELIEFLLNEEVLLTASVATEYGEALLEPKENLTVLANRMDENEMEALMTKEKFDLVIDATHPYAEVVTKNIKEACENTGLSYLRLLREKSNASDDAIIVENIDEAIAYLNKAEGNILLTTGSKELKHYAAINDFANRVYARVLPNQESIGLCQEVGLNGSHILAIQGPFSKDMNISMLKMVNANIMVSKETGHAGGFNEKVAAAKEAGAILLVVGRPNECEGKSFSEVLGILEEKFHFVFKPNVQVVGIGPGNLDVATEEVRRSIREADCLIGAKRMLEAVAQPNQIIFDAIKPEDIKNIIKEHKEYKNFAVVMAGDTGFFSGTKKLLPLLDFCNVKVMAGISSFVYLCSKIGTSYEDVVPISLHGRNHNIVSDIRKHKRVFVLVGGENGMGKLAEQLTNAGLGNVKISAGEKLSYPDEKITIGLAEELAKVYFESLSVALIENPNPLEIVTHGLPDECFLRNLEEGKVVPMTKSEVRSVCLSKLQLTKDAVCWDIGAGTGSISIEMAMQASEGEVFAIERKDNALALLKDNVEHFALNNMTIVPGIAPENCIDLPAPTHVFIGGSSGNMKDIIRLLLEKNPNVRIVASAIAVESIGELSECIGEFDFAETEVCSLTVARDRKAGKYHLMTGQNPIFIFTMQGGNR